MKKPTGSPVSEAPANPGTSRTWLWATVAALLVRLVVVAFVYQGFLDPKLDHWEFGYETGKIARSIITGHGFSNPYFGGDTGPTAEIAPVFPYLLAGIMAVLGIYTKASALAMLGLNSLFSAVTCIPIFFLAKKSFGLREARWATWIWAFFPYAIYFSADSMWDHALTALFLALLLLAAIHLEESTRLVAWAGFGLLWGISALTCPVVLGTLPFLVGWVCYRLHRQGKNWGLPALTAVLVVAATLTPWLVRNYRTFHQPVFLKDGLPLAFLAGNLGNTQHWWNGKVDPCGNLVEMLEFQRMGEQAFMAEKRQLALSVLRSHPGIFLWRSLRRVVYMWTGYWSLRPEYLREEPFDPPNILFCTAFTLLAILGWSKALQKDAEKAIPYALVVLVYPVVYYFTHSDIAYRQPLDPMIVILGSCTVVSWLGAREASQSQAVRRAPEPQPALASNPMTYSPPQDHG
jgi:4-amino-4-deoxy-L-arabinose transferase-like glycosyltransferase